jgi:hypothetical protein
VNDQVLVKIYSRDQLLFVTVIESISDQVNLAITFPEVRPYGSDDFAGSYST